MSRITSENGEQKHDGLARSAAVVGGATLFSRVLGLVRDIVLAYTLGATLSADAFFAAFRIPNFLRRMFAEGSLTAAFIPVFTEVQQKEGVRAAFRLASLTMNWLIIMLLVVTVGGILFAPQLVGVLTPGWVNDAGKFALTVDLTRIMFPFILLVSLLALAMGVLNARKHFAAPAFAPALLNIFIIVFAIWASKTMEQPTYGVAVGVILGGIAQILLQVPFLKRKGFRYGSEFSPRDPGLRKVGKLFFPSLLGSGVYQVNMVIITILASLLPHGSLSYLYYADRLVQFPLGVFAIALGTAALPAMSRQAADRDLDGLKDTLYYAFRQVSLITIPAAVGLIVLSEPLISLMFQRGRFDPMTTRMSAQALLCYGVGLWFAAEIRIVAPVYYALKDTMTPMKVATGAIVVNLAASVILMKPLLHAGLALAVSTAALVQLILLIGLLRRRFGGLDWKKLAGPLPQIGIASTAMGLALWFMVRGVDWSVAMSIAKRGGITIACVAAGVLIYGGILKILKVREFDRLLATVLGRFRRRRVEQ